MQAASGLVHALSFKQRLGLESAHLPSCMGAGGAGHTHVLPRPADTRAIMEATGSKWECNFILMGAQSASSIASTGWGPGLGVILLVCLDVRRAEQ